MQQHFIVRTGNPRLVIFALGWGADHHLVEHIIPDGYDVVCLYDYRNAGALADIKPEGISPADYSERYLFAWSFGVWAAEQIFAGETFTRAIAFNGTPFPVDENYGIEPRRMAVTIRGLASGGTDAFARRAYGGSYERLEPVLFTRSIDHNIAELRSLDGASRQVYTPTLKWDKAIVGDSDLIFPPANMQRYWLEKAEIKTEILPLPHYPFENAEVVTNEL